MIRGLLGFVFLLMSYLLVAQDKTTGMTVSNKGAHNTWYNSPWVWIIGATLFIFLLIGLITMGSKKRFIKEGAVRVTKNKTEEKQDNTDHYHNNPSIK